MESSYFIWSFKWNHTLYVPSNTCTLFMNPNQIKTHLSASMNKCNKPLKAIDLIPIFSWLMFMGKCRMCKTPIPFRYIGIEVVTVIWGITSLALSPSFIALPILFFSGLGFLFVLLCWVMEKCLPIKVLLFSCILSVLFVFFTLWYMDISIIHAIF